jgi:hypothetical protein
VRRARTAQRTHFDSGRNTHCTCIYPRLSTHRVKAAHTYSAQRHCRNLTLVMNSNGMMPIILAAASTAVMGLLSWSDLGFRMVKWFHCLCMRGDSRNEDRC